MSIFDANLIAELESDARDQNSDVIVVAVARIAAALERMDTARLSRASVNGVEIAYTRPSARLGGDDASHYIQFTWDEILGLPDHEVAELALIRWDNAELEAVKAERAARAEREKRDKAARKRKRKAKFAKKAETEKQTFERLKAKFEKKPNRETVRKAQAFLNEPTDPLLKPSRDGS